MLVLGVPTLGSEWCWGGGLGPSRESSTRASSSGSLDSWVSDIEYRYAGPLVNVWTGWTAPSSSSNPVFPANLRDRHDSSSRDFCTHFAGLDVLYLRDSVQGTPEARLEWDTWDHMCMVRCTLLLPQKGMYWLDIYFHLKATHLLKWSCCSSDLRTTSGQSPAYLPRHLSCPNHHFTILLLVKFIPTISVAFTPMKPSLGQQPFAGFVCMDRHSTAHPSLVWECIFVCLRLYLTSSTVKCSEWKPHLCLDL